MFLDILEEWDHYESGWRGFVDPQWMDNCNELRKAFDASGLRNDFYLTVRSDGYGVFQSFGLWIPWYERAQEDLDWLRSELNGLEELRDIDFGGFRQWNTPKWARLQSASSMQWAVDTDMYSPLLVLKLFNFTKVMREVGLDFSTLDSVVQWGGGFGYESRFMRKFGLRTEYLLDLPMMSLVQHQYLGHAIGRENVHLVDSPESEVVKGKINCVPLPFRDKVPDGEMFLALHSLNESAPDGQQWVADRSYFGADKLLLAWTEDLKRHNGSSFSGVKSWRDHVRDLSLTPVFSHYYREGRRVVRR